MKTIKELRKGFDLKTSELASSLKYFANKNIDFDVFLPTKGKNLQREYVWTLDQKRELINSVLIGRHIPHCAIIDTIDQNNRTESILQVIDGKQRLMSLIGFYNGAFSIVIDGSELFYNDLPTEYQIEISHFHFRYYIVYEDFNKPITDEQKINWFKFINFAGTAQETEHMNSLN